MPLFPPDSLIAMELKDNQSFFKALLKRTLLFNILLLAGMIAFYPEEIGALAAGMGLGVLYILSLAATARSQVKHWQLPLSFFRMLLFAVLIAWLGNFNTLGIIVVICGFLSYKGVLILDCILFVIKSSCSGSKTSDDL
jgi:hypothetical protein